ncbi:MAG TPA: type II toxin-antitoxin system PemK/MazF family toxin [Pyrinomonadaceae bacterium]|nr:type II toxin-antitoxin system PemK/MazF family toxin [Pyrinomonadaceae bacterium]
MAKVPVKVVTRGDIYLVEFDPAVGSEIAKTRPAIVLQNDTANRYSPITIVAAITSKFDDNLYPTEVLIRSGEAGLKQDSVVALNQIRTIDKARIIKRIGKVTSFTLKRIDVALKISVGLD